MAQGSKVRKCPKRPEAGDLQRFFKRHASRENFPVYGLQGIIGEGTFIACSEPLKNLAFTIGLIKPRFLRALDIADFYNDFRAPV